MLSTFEHLDRLCDSQNCFNDRPFDQIALDGKERIAMEIVQETEDRYNHKINQIGMNRATAQYIYDFLKDQAVSLENDFYIRLGKPNYQDVREFEQLASSVLQRAEATETYFLKESTAIRLLINMPPAGLMKCLGHSTLNELMDSEDIFTIYSLVRITETSDWTQCFIRMYTDLSFDDFERRAIRLKILDPNRYPFSIPRLLEKQTVWEDKMMGTIFGIPVPSLAECPAPLLRTITRTFHYHTELTFHSRFLVESSKEPRVFGDRLSRLLLGKFEQYNFFEPHCLSENLYWKKTHAFLHSNFHSIEGLGFWSDCIRTGGLADGNTISFNLLDVLTNVSKSKPFPGNTRMLAMSIKGAVFNKIVNSDSLEEDLLLRNMDNGEIDVSTLCATNKP